MRFESLEHKIEYLEAQIRQARDEADQWRINCIEAMRAGNEHISKLESEISTLRKDLFNIMKFDKED